MKQLLVTSLALLLALLLPLALAAQEDERPDASEVSDSAPAPEAPAVEEVATVPVQDVSELPQDSGAATPISSVGSCAQIGANVHLSGGGGIGGVLEPPQAAPVIIEDDCFIGARSKGVEGVIVEKGAVISMGVFIGQSAPIYDRDNGQTLYGRVPAGSVVVAGSLPKDGGRYSLNCAVIVKKVDAQTRGKVGINALLRDL